jgi:RNA recognition motif-containing protein
MIKGKSILFLIVTTIFFIMLSGLASAEERNIYVGDLIELRVSIKNTDEDELRDKFKDFEIVDIKDDAGIYLITLRSFETGEKTVELGDKEIVIDVKSTLDDIKSEDIIEGDLSPEDAGFSIDWKYVLIGVLLIFLVTGGVSIWKYIKSRKVSSLSPYQMFVQRSKEILPDDSDGFGKLTVAFKQYLETICSCPLRGKTSCEIIGEIGNIQRLQAFVPPIQSWLEESDRLKYTGISVPGEKKKQLFDELIRLAGNIEDTKEGD